MLVRILIQVHVERLSHERSCNVAILADDLTSAADAAGPFVAEGVAATVGCRAIPSKKAVVCAVDAASRSLSAREASIRVERFANDLRDAPILFKTVDSTLRGHVREEIAASLRGADRSRIVFAPAFPDAGRTTVDGVQLVAGIPVHLSPYGQDPVHPARISSLQNLLPANAINAMILDAQTQDDLDQQVSEIDHPETVLWVGSPSLARALSKRNGVKGQVVRPSCAGDGASLVVVDSANDVSHRQAARLNETASTVLIAPKDRRGDPSIVLRELIDQAVCQLATGAFGSLIATGGDTMEAILESVSVQSFDLLGEIEPGFPVGSAEIAGRLVLLGMKAGGFGDDATLERAVAQLSKRTQEQSL